MEIKLDIGKNIYTRLSILAQKQNKKIDNFAMDILDFGLRIHEKSLEESNDNIDPIQEKILQNIVENNMLTQELSHMVFNKEKCNSKMYDAESLNTSCKMQAESYIKGIYEK